jgi:hypothetical protein
VPATESRGSRREAFPQTPRFGGLFLSTRFPGTGPWSAPRFRRKRFKTLLFANAVCEARVACYPVICTVFVAANLGRVSASLESDSIAAR